MDTGRTFSTPLRTLTPPPRCLNHPRRRTSIGIQALFPLPREINPPRHRLHTRGQQFLNKVEGIGIIVRRNLGIHSEWDGRTSSHLQPLDRVWGRARL